MSPSRLRSPSPVRLRSAVLGLTIGTVVLLGLTALLNLVIIGAIWPGEAKLFAPILCTDSHPDAYVVSDTYQVSDGTSVEFSVYCVAPDGDAVDAGWARAWFLGWVLHTLLVLVVIAAFALRAVRRTRRRLRAEATTPDAPAG